MSKGKKIYCIASFAFACAVLILTITLCMMHPGRVYASSMDPDSITKITIDYITALLSHDVSVIRNLTNSEYYNSLISNNVLNGAEIMHIISMTPVVEDSELGFSYGSRTVLVYSADGGITRNQLTLNLKMFRDEDGSFVLSDMDKTIVDSISAVSETTE